MLMEKIENESQFTSGLVIGHEFWRLQWKVLEGQEGRLMEQVRRDTGQFENKHSHKDSLSGSLEEECGLDVVNLRCSKDVVYPCQPNLFDHEPFLKL